MKCLKCGKEFEGRKENANVCIDCAFDITIDEIDREYMKYLEDLNQQVWFEKLAAMEWR